MKKFIRFIYWLLIGSTIIIILRLVIVSYIEYAIIVSEKSESYSWIAIKYSNDFFYYNRGNNISDWFITISTLIYTLNFVTLYKIQIKEKNIFYDDYLLYRSFLIGNMNLRKRRILSTILISYILIGVMTYFDLQLNFIFNFPGVRGIQRDEVEIILWTQFASLFLFWFTIGIVQLINWILSSKLDE